MLYKYKLNTPEEDFISITSQIKGAIAESNVKNGICTVYCPHTTAGITINENADPDVIGDLIIAYKKAFPDLTEFKHCEGNSSAHAKASAIGSSVSIIIHEGNPLLGVWQGIFFCEFDGPRKRTFYVNISEND